MEVFANKSFLKRLLAILLAGSITSFFVTFTLSEGFINPNKFLNNFFKFWPGYMVVIPGLGLTWGVGLSFMGTLFRAYLCPRIAEISSKSLRVCVVGVAGFLLGFLGLMAIYYACRWLFNFTMWALEWNFSVTLMGGLFGSLFAFLYYADYEKQRLLQEAEVREQELARHQIEGELMNLNLRIRPHFFFNALNTLASLIDKDRNMAQEFLADLADLFRMSFTHGQDQPTCNWHEEKAILTAYLAVENVRFIDRLQWHIDVDAPDDALFPAFLLQPLVENAVHHGISPSQSMATLNIDGAYQDGSWQICIINSLTTRVEAEIKKGHALWTIKERLKLMKGTLDIEITDEAFCVILNWTAPETL